jgi:putative phosphoesterase
MDRGAKTRELTIGVISDTHGLVRPEAVRALAGVELILHAGDIGGPHVLEELGRVAPVVAIRGNNDRGPWADKLPATETTEVGGLFVYMLHDLKDLNLDSASGAVQVVVSGHSHRPSVEEREGLLYLNPGSAGPRRFKLPVSVALLRVKGAVPSAEIIELHV